MQQRRYNTGRNGMKVTDTKKKTSKKFSQTGRRALKESRIFLSLHSVWRRIIQPVRYSMLYSIFSWILLYTGLHVHQLLYVQLSFLTRVYCQRCGAR